MIDPRSENADKIIPPHPLPHVSRRALKRVANPLPAPNTCTYCSGPVQLVPNSVIYSGRSYGDWPYAYLCRPCRAYVGLHPDTDIPLGTLADKDLRESRKEAKESFHELTRKSQRSRTEMYTWLAEKMGIEIDVCHFGWFNHEQCFLARQACNNEL